VVNVNFEQVLVVEPRGAARAKVRELLSAIGVAAGGIVETDDAEQGIHACCPENSPPPQVVLLALALAGAQGNEWLQQTRAHYQALPLPVVLLAANEAELADEARVGVALAAGAEDVLALEEATPAQVRRVLGRALIHHQAAYELAQRDAHFRGLAEGSPDLLWAHEAAKGCTFVNAAWLAHSGRALEEELGEGWLGAVHPEDVARVRAGYLHAYDTRLPFELEFRLRRHDGVYRWILNRGHPHFDGNGRFIGFTGTCVDITERRMMVEELQRSEDRFRMVLRISKIAVFTMDRNLRYTWIYNAQAGFSDDELLGKHDSELMSPEAAAPYLEFKEEALRQEKPVHRLIESNLGGRYICFDMTAERVLDAAGEVAGLMVVGIDVTEPEQERRYARFLAEASEYLNASLDYATTLQQVAQAMVPNLADWCSVDVVTEEGRIEQVAIAHSDPQKLAWAKEFRRQNPPALDDPLGLPNVIRTGKSELYPEITQEMILATGPTPEELAVHAKLALKSLLLVPLVARGRVLGGLTLVWSDSDRRYSPGDVGFAEELARRAATAIDNAWLYADAQARAEELHRFSELLEQRVEERTRDLERSNQDLDQFAYVASHDLKAPLRALDHLSSWIAEDAGHLLPERSRDHLAKMQGRIKRMEGLLDDLLAYSRAGRFRGQSGWVDLAELLARSIETVSPPEGFTVEVVGTLPTIYTAHVPLGTVLRNLVGNAVKHHDKESGRILIRAVQEPAQMIFTVEDDGPGIDPAYHERIFQMFQTLRPRDQVEGSGIGLSVVKRIIESRGGQISVDAEVGRGAKFTFTWPYQAPEEDK
jgi:PAS domain S-box-containing protein